MATIYDVAARAWMYTTRVPRMRELRPRHSVQNQWDLLEPLGIPRPTPDTHPTELTAEPGATRAVDAWLGHGPTHCRAKHAPKPKPPAPHHIASSRSTRPAWNAQHAS